MSRIRLIGRNISFVALSRLVSLAVSFCLFPFILKHVGKETYGVYLIATTITGYFGLLDLGVMSSLTKYVSEYNGRKDSRGVINILNASFSFYMVIGVIIALLSFISALYFDKFFKIEPANILIFRQLFIAAGIFALASWPLSTFRGAIQGMNLWNIDSSVNILTQIFNALVTLAVFSLDYGIVQLFVATKVLTILGNIIFYYAIKRRLNFKIEFPYMGSDTYKIIFNFSIFIFLASMVSMLIYQMHNIIIGYFISLSAVSIFAVAYNIQNYVSIVNSTLGSPPWVTASEMEGSRNYEGQRSLILKGTKFMSAVFMPIVLITLFFTEPFINYWMGQGFQESILPARIILLLWLFYGTSELASGMISAKGMVKKVLFIHIIVAAVGLIIGLSLIKILGITAIALGFCLPTVLLGFPLILKFSLRSLNISFKEYFNKAVKKNFWLYGVVIVFSLCAIKYFYPRNIYHTLFEMGLIYCFSLTFHYVFILDKEEKIEIGKLIGVR